jgi:hypothetical protein
MIHRSSLAWFYRSQLRRSDFRSANLAKNCPVLALHPPDLRISNRHAGLLVIFLTLGFATGNEAASLQRAKLGGDDGEAIFDVAVAAKEDPYKD